MDQPLVTKITSDLLTADQQELLNGLRETYPTIPSGMTDYQIEMFVLQATDQPTWYAVYYQCVLESWTRFKSILSRLQGLEIERRKMNVKKVRAQILREEGSSLSLATAELVEYQILVAEQNQAISLHELQNSFHELETFERVRKIAANNLKVIPEWGDPSQEKARWALRFMLQGHPWRKSLVGGDMEELPIELYKILDEKNARLLEKLFPPQKKDK